MTQIKIFQPETYSIEIKKVRESILNFPENIKRELIETKFLNDYASSKMWDMNLERSITN